MSEPIEDYALIGDCRSAALVSRDGSVDWLCVPRFDSPSVFAALLGDDGHGHWSLRPTDPNATATRRYEDGTFTLVTRWETATGVAEVRDLMPMDHRHRDLARRSDLLRRITGVTGTVEFAQQLRMRFDYARVIPWVRQVGTDESPALLATAGPDSLIFRGARLTASDHRHAGRVAVAGGERVDLSMTWFPSHFAPPEALDCDEAIERTDAWWRRWADRITADGLHSEAVKRSLLVLRALTDYDTGGIVAAATTSLPEEFGGPRNWDYRYVWLRDAALTLETLIRYDFLDIAQHWREWLLRAIAGDPAQLQIMYGIAGERNLAEWTLESLPGYENSTPVRIGNGAYRQYQADVIGETLTALSCARDAGLTETGYSWSLQRSLVGYLIENLDRPDQGIWEMRGTPRKFTHSRIMMWAGLDCAIRGMQQHGFDGPLAEWERTRDRLRAEIESEGVHPDGYFTQSYGSDEVDASLLLIPNTGFCRADDPRMLATVARIEQSLMHEGLLHRYRETEDGDGLGTTENPFIACSFWLVDQYALSGRMDDARALAERLCALQNDVGLISEQVEASSGRHAGNTPQALSHIALVNAVMSLAAVSAADAAG